MNVPSVKDKYYLTYGVFYLLGILTFMPSYFAITANRYWMFKFRHMQAPPLPDPHNGTFPMPPQDRNILQVSFSSAYYIVSQLSLIVFATLTAANSKKLPPPDRRISAALSCTLMCYLANFIFPIIITDSFQVIFFFMVLFIGCLLGACGAVILISLFELIRKFPAECYTALLTGQALCGAISAFIQILTIVVTEAPITGGLIFFGNGTILVLVTMVVFCHSKKNSQYFVYNTGNESWPELTFEHRKFFPRMWMKYMSVPNYSKVCIVSLAIAVGSTAIVSPGYLALVVGEKSSDKPSSAWNDLFFVPVITFLFASVCDLTGRFLASRIRKPENELVILVLAVLRIGFIGLFAFSNARPRFSLPVYFHDKLYIVFVMTFFFSNGYLINLCVTLVAKRAESEEEMTKVTIMAVIFAVFSAAFNSFLSLLLVYLI